MAWAFEPPGDVGPVATDGTVAFVADSAGHLYGIDPENRRVEWERSFENPVGSRRGFHGSLRVIDGYLYAFTATMGAVHAQEYTLHRLDPVTGETLWTQNPGIGYSILTILDATSDTLLIGAGDDQLGDGQDPAFTVDVETGRRQWQVQVGDADSGVLGDQRAFVGTYGGVSGIERSTGKRLWRREIRDPTPIFRGDSALFAASKEYEQSRALALDPASGETRWEYAEGIITSLNDDDAAGGPFVGGSQVVSLGADGTPRWQADRSGLIARTPIADGVLYGLTDSEVFGLTTADGDQVFSYEPGWKYPRPVTVEADTVVVAAGRSARLGGVTTGGEQRWTAELPGEGVGSVETAGGRLVLSNGGRAFGRLVTD